MQRRRRERGSGHRALHDGPAVRHATRRLRRSQAQGTEPRSGSRRSRGVRRQGRGGLRAGRRGLRHLRRARSPSTRPRSPSMLAVKPESLSFEQAAAAPISGVTALQAVRKAGVAARNTRADHRRVGRRRHLRSADRQGVRRRGHRRLQHGEGRPGPVDRRRPRARLHARSDLGWRPPIRRHPRHRWQPAACPSSAELSPIEALS